jgi:transcriptional antiterminator NusG
MLKYINNFYKKKKILIGEIVKIINGPFQGINGIVNKINNNKKIELNILIFGRKISLKLDFTQIKKI